MEGTVETAETVEATIVDKGGTPPVPTPAPVVDGFSGKPGDLQADLALLATQQGAPPQEAPKASEPVVQEPEQPAATATAPATPVPDKFKNPDGTLNEDRLAKSKDAALAEYHKIEAELRKAQNERAQLRNQTQQPHQPQTPPVPQIQNLNLTPFEREAAIDILNDAQALGLQMTEQQAILQARANIRMAEAKYNAELSATEDIRQRFENQDRERQLSAIADADPWVFSPEGIRTLADIRRSTPHVNQAREPWQAAYDQHLANEVKKQRLAGMVQAPTPKAPAARAPAPPVGAAPRAVVQSTAPKVEQMSADQVTEYVKTLDPKAEAAFWASRGLKF